MAEERANPYERAVVLDPVRGELTDREYAGTFRVRVALSQGEILRRGVVFRELLGPHSMSASIDDASLADKLSELSVRIVEAPGWWTSALNGLELRDAAPVDTLARKVREAVAEYEKEVRARAEAARAELKQSK